MNKNYQKLRRVPQSSDIRSIPNKLGGDHGNAITRARIKSWRAFCSEIELAARLHKVMTQNLINPVGILTKNMMAISQQWKKRSISLSYTSQNVCLSATY